MKNGFKKVNEQLAVSLAGNFATATFRASIPQQDVSDDAKKVLAEASLWDVGRARSIDSIEVPPAPLPIDESRYVYAEFRALSQVLLRNRGIDFSRDGVLKKATSMLAGKTVYPNHDFFDVNNWVGVVSNAKWDAKGERSNGVPGINVEIKLDAYLNYRLACGVLMQPPAVNAMSLTVVFEFEYSHPQMAAESGWKFYENLGEEIDGEVVRLIVTKVVEIWEASLVPVGEDRLAKNITDDATKSFSADEAETAAGEPPPNSTDTEKTMKLTSELKQKLGIEFDGDEVPDDQVVAAVDSLSAKAASVPANLAELEAKASAGDKLVAEKRADVIRLAKLAELSKDDEELDQVVVDSINDADVERLQKLGAYYQKRVADKFPAGGRSSLENTDEIDNAGGVADKDIKALPEAGLL